jgi:signal transduction histidine kinase/CheY-like chemotaxis protein
MDSALGIFANRRRLRTQLKTSRGQMFYAEVALVKYEDTFGRSIIIAFVRDLTDIIAHENDLKRARDKALQLMSAKGRFLNMMSHEMKTPLHGVIASLDLLKGDFLSRDDRENLQIARDSAAAALAQVEDVLAISSNDAGADTVPLKPFDPVEVIKLIVGQARLKARNKDVTVDYTITPKEQDSLILGREEAFRRAVANLVDNAVKFTEIGSVKVDLAFGPEDAPDRRLTVKVSDTGPGIAPDVQNRAFQDFQTVSHGAALWAAGSGLGLGIARRAVTRMGGILHLDSRENEGCHFSFDIPAPLVAKPQSTGIVLRAKNQAAPLHRTQSFTRALVVDDNAANRILMHKMLERLGYSVQCAENGEHAIELADTWRFALILMDIHMPGLDGFEAAMAIRGGRSSRDAVILGVTANLASQDAERFKVSGMQEMLAKPMTIGQLSEKVSYHIDGLKNGSFANLSDVEVFDEEDQFVISATSGNLSFISESMQCNEFEGWLHACFDEIRHALDAAERNEPDFLQAIHKAAGTAGFIGLPELQAALNQMEVASNQTDTGLFKSAFFDASDIFRRVRVDLTDMEEAG